MTSVVPFFLLGLLNNTPYVLLIASAKRLSEGGTGLIFLACVVPGFLIKLSAPYWFDAVSFDVRIWTASTCMIMSFLVVSFLAGEVTENPDEASDLLPYILAGVALISVQCGLGEATLLSLTGMLSSQALTAFCSGTGLAGPAGFGYVFAGDWLFSGSLRATLASATLLALAYVHSYHISKRQSNREPSTNRDVESTPLQKVQREVSTFTSSSYDDDGSDDGENSEATEAIIPLSRGFVDRCRFVMSLWPYMIPLFTVYAAEYACQAGTWTAMGFPVADPVSRSRFFSRANTLYQVGVWLSRSSGNLFEVDMVGLWIMPMIQVLNLGFFYAVALHEDTFWLYDPILLYMLSFVTGLLGGAVYVHGYQRIVRDFSSETKALALASVSVAEGSGVMVADGIGLFLQACLYEIHDIPGAVVSCPWRIER